MTEKSMIDTRTFGEIYDSLNEVKQAELRERIKFLCKCSDSAIRNWKLGNRRPHPVFQVQITTAVNKILKIKSAPEFLFPR